jgi:Spy/CpxP family protein refolding chaperone
MKSSSKIKTTILALLIALVLAPSIHAQTVGAKQRGHQGSAIGQPIGATASGDKGDAAKTKGQVNRPNTKTIGQAVDSGYGLAKKRDAANQIKGQVNQLVASRTPDKNAAQHLLKSITEQKKALRNLQVQQNQGPAQRKDKSELSFQIQDLMSEYNQSEALLRHLLAKKSDTKSR